jgi:hypothetical protein
MNGRSPYRDYPEIPVQAGAYTFEEMRRGLVRGWSELGARTADCWLDYNERLFGGQLMPLPMFSVPVAPYGHMIGWTCALIAELAQPRGG